MNVGHKICIPAWKNEGWNENKEGEWQVSLLHSRGQWCGPPTWQADSQHGKTWVQEEDHQQADISQGETDKEFVEGGEMLISDLWYQ